MPTKASTLECLKRFAESFLMENPSVGDSRKMAAKRNRLCDLLGISDTTGHEWFVNHSMPIGMNLVKLQLLLTLVGKYVPVEPEMMSKDARNLADQTAFGVVSVDEIARQTDSTHDTVMRWFSGKTAPIGSKIEIIRSICETHRADEINKRGEWLGVLSELGIVHDGAQPIVLAADQPGSVIQLADPHHRKQTIDMLVHMIRAMEPLAAEVASDAFSDDDRAELRRATTVVRHSALFNLSNSLGRLCSERARKQP